MQNVTGSISTKIGFACCCKIIEAEEMNVKFDKISLFITLITILISDFPIGLGFTILLTEIKKRFFKNLQEEKEPPPKTLQEAG